ncbi:MAG: hypothetical protein CSA81_00715 [Acidobacteria bacterium]|nr:MAG: hypothetical protein CSA81_00715 [Acidobacteriota bacterium]
MSGFQMKSGLCVPDQMKKHVSFAVWMESRSPFDYSMKERFVHEPECANMTFLSRERHAACHLPGNKMTKETK